MTRKRAGLLPRAPTAGYSQELAARICAELAAGESLKDVVTSDWAPSEKTVYRWRAMYPEFKAALLEARLIGCERYAEETITIADQAPETSEGVAKARLRVDVRKWHLSKLLPKQYGDNLTLSGDAERPLKAELSLEVVGVSAAAELEVVGK